MVTPMEGPGPASTLTMDACISLVGDALNAMPNLGDILDKSDVRIDITAATPDAKHQVRSWPPVQMSDDGVTIHVIAVLVSDASPFEYSQEARDPGDGSGEAIVNVPRTWQVHLPRLASATLRAAREKALEADGHGRAEAGRRIREYLVGTGRPALAERHAAIAKSGDDR